jgi:hypothetical protein
MEEESHCFFSFYTEEQPWLTIAPIGIGRERRLCPLLKKVFAEDLKCLVPEVIPPELIRIITRLSHEMTDSWRLDFIHNPPYHLRTIRFNIISSILQSPTLLIRPGYVYPAGDLRLRKRGLPEPSRVPPLRRFSRYRLRQHLSFTYLIRVLGQAAQRTRWVDRRDHKAERGGGQGRSGIAG